MGATGVSRNSETFGCSYMWVFPKIRGTLLGVTIIQDYSIQGSILRFPYVWKLPCGDCKEILEGVATKGSYVVCRSSSFEVC